MLPYSILLSWLLVFQSFMTTPKHTQAMLKYLVREPKIANSKPPLIVLLHGVGSNESDLFSFADKLPAKYLIVSLQAPIHLGSNQYAWYQVDFSKGKPIYDPSQVEKSRLAILKFLDDLGKEHPYQSNEVILCGFSQGAIMSYTVAINSPAKIKGIAVMSGRVLTEVKNSVQLNATLKNLKVFISHGTKDPVLPIHHAREAKLFIESLGIQPSYHEYEETHTINQQMLNDLVGWLNF